MRQSKKKTKSEDLDLLSIDQYSLSSDSEPLLEQDIPALASEQETTAVPLEPVKLTPEALGAQEQLNRLILQDLAVAPATVKKGKEEAPVQIDQDIAREAEPQVPRVEQRPRGKRQNLQYRVTEKPSQYVLDLRKHFLIEKYNLSTLERPRERLHVKVGAFFSSLKPRERIEWRYPEDTRRKKSSIDRQKYPLPEAEQSLPAVAPSSALEVIPEQQSPSTAIVTIEDEIVEEHIPWRMRVYAVGTFWIVLLFVLVPIPIITYASRISSDGHSVLQKGLLAFSSLKAGVADITNSDYMQAQGSLTQAQKSFNEITTTLESYAVTLHAVSRVVPTIGSKVALAKAVSDIGDHTAALGLLLSDSLASGGSSRTTTDRLLELQQHIKSIAGALEASQGELKHIDVAMVPEEWRGQFQYIQQHSSEFIQSLHRADAMLEVAVHILGADSLSRYLVVFQNSHELRPTGGFMGSFALIDFSKGSPLSIDFPGGGTYDLEGGFKQHLVPPHPIAILNQEWHIWDSNWWPDFPTSAKKIAWFYRESGGRTVDGVIAINSDFVVDVLRAVGPIEMPEYGITVSADSFYSVLQNEVELGYDKSLNQPKKILKDLMPRLIDHMFKASNYQQLLAITTQSLAQKDIQITALNDDKTQASLEKLGWDGSLVTNAKDYLAVISTNIAGGKSDASIYQTIDHQAVIDDRGAVTVTTTITKEHRAEPADQFAYVNNVDYVRFYVPLGSTLVRATGFEQPADDLFHAPSEAQSPDSDLAAISGLQTVDQSTGTTISRELGHTVFGNWMQVQPGSHTTATITYTLPFKIAIPESQGVSWLTLWGKQSQEVDSYSLLVQRQSGKKNTIINSSVLLPEQYAIVWSDAVDPAHAGTAPHVFTYSNDLNFDTYYALLLARKAKE